MERPNTNACGQGDGRLPGRCAPLAFPYVPMQEPDPPRYDNAMALQTGTLFPGLNLPFKAAMTDRLKTNNTALAELMALDFAVDELGVGVFDIDGILQLLLVDKHQPFPPFSQGHGSRNHA